MSEDPDSNVLLLEAGPPDAAAEISVPAAAPSLWQGRYAWDDATVPQPHAADRTVVRYLHDGAERVARTRGDVLLCGGAVNSPKLLLMSGIGPAGHLGEQGIRVLVDAPRVGDGL